MDEWITLTRDHCSIQAKTWLFQARKSDGEVHVRWSCDQDDSPPSKPVIYADVDAIALRDWLIQQYPLTPPDDRSHPSLEEIRASDEYQFLARSTTISGLDLDISEGQEQTNDGLGQLFGLKSMWADKTYKLSWTKPDPTKQAWSDLIQQLVCNAMWIDRSRQLKDPDLERIGWHNQEQAIGELLRRIYLLLGLKNDAQKHPENRQTSTTGNP